MKLPKDALDDQYISYTSESSFDYKVGDTYVLALSKLDEDTEYSLLGNGYGAFKFDTDELISNLISGEQVNIENLHRSNLNYNKRKYFIKIV